METEVFEKEYLSWFKVMHFLFCFMTNAIR